MVGVLAERYSKKPAIRSLLHLIPGWGAADTLLQYRADEIRKDRARTFFDELSEGKHEITDELIEKEDFLHSYFATLRAILNTRQREKIRLFARLLNSSLAPTFGPTTDEYEEFLSVLEATTLREFAVLRDLRTYELKHVRTAEENELQNAWKFWDQFKSSSVRTYGIPDEAFPAFMAKLEWTGLYLRITGGYMDYGGDIGRTTPLFARLLELVSDSRAQQAHASDALPRA